MLRVSIYDPLHAQSNDEIQKIGENGLIDVHSGHANWEKHLVSENTNRIGKLLVSGWTFILPQGTRLTPSLVSAQAHIRRGIRDHIRSHINQDVELFEPEFQPWGKAGSLRAYLKP
jgi:hypothetical protein